MSMVTPETATELLSPATAELIRHQRKRAVERALADFHGLSLTDRLLATDVCTYLPDDLLVKMDIASMANSLETRSPLLDHKVVEFGARLPTRLKLHNLHQKHLLRALARKLLPVENVDRPKMGFGVPIADWLRGELRELAADALLSSQASARGLFRPAAV